MKRFLLCAFLLAFLFVPGFAISADAAVESDDIEIVDNDTGSGMLAAMTLLQEATDAYADELMSNPPEGMDRGDVALVFGNLYALGVLGQPDDTKAREYLEAALAAGMSDAGVPLGAMYLTGIGDATPKDTGKALEYYENAASAGSVDGMRILGRLYLDGDNDVPANRAEGKRYLLEAARSGDEYALDRLQPDFQAAADFEKDNPGKKADFPVSREAARDVALVEKRDNWNRRMASNIATVYQGLERVLYSAMGMDYGAVSQRKQAEQNFSAAFDDIAASIVAGQPSEKEEAEAAFAVGTVYAYGLAGTVNLDKAREYFLRSAEKGLPEAWAAAAEIYAGDIDTVEYLAMENTARAVEYYERAADAGVHRAMFALGEMYLNGRDDLPADKPKALRNFVGAAAFGDEDAVARLDEVMSTLTEAERKEMALPEKAADAVDPEKVAAMEQRIAELGVAFERTETELRAALEQAMSSAEEME